MGAGHVQTSCTRIPHTRSDAPGGSHSAAAAGKIIPLTGLLVNWDCGYQSVFVIPGLPCELNRQDKIRLLADD